MTVDTATSRGTPPGAAATAALPPAAARRAPARGRVIVWGGYALALLLAPLVFSGSLAISMLSQIGIAIVACLSYNMLLGQGGMLSFGHAVYSGLATFISIHALLGIASGAFPVPVSLVPVVGGLAGAFFAVLLGYVTTKKAGTPFAMITLGIGELVANMVLMVPEFFGGEGGVSANRTVGKPFLGITFGPPIQVYYLIAVYTFLCTIGMYAFTRTPLGRMLNAVRDNPERVEFIGYSTQRVRYLSFIIAGFFAGVAGGMYALNFEIATAEVVGALRSGLYLLFTFLGGATFFFGPIIGAILMVVSFTLLSELTKGWPLYLGLVFVLMVMFAPGGIASLIMMNVRVAAHRKLARAAVWYPALLATLLVMVLGAAMLIELFYQLQLGAGNETHTSVIGIGLDTQSAASWIAGVVVLLAGAGLFEWVRRRFARVWGEVQTEIEAENAAREGR
jgi:branched-chain amino acid transport system permease protein